MKTLMIIFLMASAIARADDDAKAQLSHCLSELKLLNREAYMMGVDALNHSSEGRSLNRRINIRAERCRELQKAASAAKKPGQ